MDGPLCLPMIRTVKDIAYCERIADLFGLRLLQGENSIECFKECLDEYFDAGDHVTVKRLFVRACSRRIGNAVEETEFIRSANRVIAADKRGAETEVPLPVTEDKKPPWWKRIF
jgi:hypothetical protein